MKITKEQLKQIIKEEIGKITEYEDSWGSGPEFTPEQQNVMTKIEELMTAFDEMGESNPEMTDHYIMLFRTIRDAGVRIEAITQMA